MRTDNNYGLSDEDKKLARRENASLTRVLYTFLMSCAFGIIAFFAVWRLKDAVPVFIVSMTEDVRQSDPSRLITYATMAISGVLWFVSFAALWVNLQKKESLKKCLKPLIIWCSIALAVYLLAEVLVRIALAN